VGLDVDDQLVAEVRGPLGRNLRVGRLGRLDREERAEDGVEREKARGHPAARLQELPPIEPERRPEGVRRFEHPLLHLLHLGCLVTRGLFFFGPYPRRKRKDPIAHGVPPFRFFCPRYPEGAAMQGGPMPPSAVFV
jgi:hypothetical protein